MNLQVTFKHMDTSPHTESYVTTKLSKLCDKYVAGHDVKAHAVLTVEKIRFISNLAVHVDGSILSATEEGTQMLESVDLALAKLERQLHDFKTKVRGH
jgi:ribosomal subunit interface protein